MILHRLVCACATYLVVGMLMSVAVAWRCALSSPVMEATPARIMVEYDTPTPFVWLPWVDTRSERPQLYREARGFGVQSIANIHSRSFINQRTAHGLMLVDHERGIQPHWVLPHDEDVRSDVHLSIAVGWPMKCLYAQCVESDLRWHFMAQYESDPTRANRMRQVRRRIAPPDWNGAIVVQEQEAPFTARVLPYRPLALGLVVNVLFWSLVLLMVHRGAQFVLRWMRLRRGLCLACQYDLRGQVGDAAGCPECGWLRPKKIAHRTNHFAAATIG